MKLFKILTGLALSFVGLTVHAQNSALPALRIKIPRLYQASSIIFNPGSAAAQGKRELGITGSKFSMANSDSDLSGSIFYHRPSGESELQSNIGVVVTYDSFGPYWKGKFGLVYSKGIRISEKVRLALGAQLSAKYLNIDYDKRRRLDPAAPALVSVDNDLRPDVDVGIWFGAYDFYLGGSVVNMLEPKFRMKGEAGRQDMRELVATTGYKINFGNNLDLTPSVLYQWGFDTEEAEVTIGAMATLKFIMFGINYRGMFDKPNPFVVNAGVQFNDKFQLSISADVPKENPTEFQENPLELNLRVKF